MKLFSSKKRVAAIGALTAATLVGGGMAYGYWTTTGTGAGSATTAAADSTLAFTQNTLNAMYPGDAEQLLQVTVENESTTQSAYVTGVTASVETSVLGCDGSDFLINGSPANAAVTLNWDGVDIAAAGSESSPAEGEATAHNTIQFNNKDSIQDACQAIDGTSETITINYTAS